MRRIARFALGCKGGGSYGEGEVSRGPDAKVGSGCQRRAYVSVFEGDERTDPSGEADVDAGVLQQSKKASQRALREKKKARIGEGGRHGASNFQSLCSAIGVPCASMFGGVLVSPAFEVFVLRVGIRERVVTNDKRQAM